MRRIVKIYQRGKLKKERSFTACRDCCLPWVETEWLHNQLSDLLGTEYSLEKVGTYVDFVEDCQLDEFCSSNRFGKSVIIKVYKYEEPR